MPAVEVVGEGEKTQISPLITNVWSANTNYAAEIASLVVQLYGIAGD